MNFYTHDQLGIKPSVNAHSSVLIIMYVYLKPATHLAILYADRGEFDRQRKSLAIFADRGDVAVLKTYVIKSSNLMGWLYWRLAAINVENRGNEFNRRYLTCQISAILNADRGYRRKSQSLHRAHLAIFADRGDRRIKSPSVSLALYVSRFR